MSDLLVREALGSLVDSRDDSFAARVELRRQIGRLELRLGRLCSEAFPRVGLDSGVRAAAVTPRALGLGELEQVRDELAARVTEAERALEDRDELERGNRELLDDMLAHPERHKW